MQKSVTVPAAQTTAVGRKLGGQIERLRNSVLQVQGKPIQINAIQASNATSAKAIHDARLKMKPYPFVVRKGNAVVNTSAGIWIGR